MTEHDVKMYGQALTAIETAITYLEMTSQDVEPIQETLSTLKDAAEILEIITPPWF